MNEALRVAIAGGSTAGHATIGLAIAQALTKLEPGAGVLFCGSHGGVELSIAKTAGLATQSVPATGLLRERSLRALLHNFGAGPLVNTAGLLQARRILGRFRPQVVVGVGGFASVPWVLAAGSRRIPTLLHEANAPPGIANRFLSRLTTVTCLSDAVALRWFRGQGIEVTGTPVHVPPVPVAKLDAAACRKAFGLDPDRPTLLVSGGTLGSPCLNDWVRLSEGELQARGVQVLWQCGPSQSESFMNQATTKVRIVPFIADIHSAYRAADLVVSAAGASTMAELQHWGVPAILVPTAGVADDHQLEAARRAERRGWAVSMPDEVHTELLPRVLELMQAPMARTELVHAREPAPQRNPAELIAARIIALGKANGAA